jgi:hypothetical protein
MDEANNSVSTHTSITTGDFLVRILRRVDLSLSSNSSSVVGYVLRIALMASLPVAMILLIVVSLGYSSLNPDTLVYTWPVKNLPIGWVLGLVDILFLSPLVETGLALVPIWLLRKLRVPYFWIPLISSLFWGLLHCRGGQWIALLQAWPFYCFTIVLIAHEKPSLDRAWLIGSAVHSVYNMIMLSVSMLLARWS